MCWAEHALALVAKSVTHRHSMLCCRIVHAIEQRTGTRARPYTHTLVHTRTPLHCASSLLFTSHTSVRLIAFDVVRDRCTFVLFAFVGMVVRLSNGRKPVSVCHYVSYSSLTFLCQSMASSIAPKRLLKFRNVKRILVGSVVVVVVVFGNNISNFVYILMIVTIIDWMAA